MIKNQKNNSSSSLYTWRSIDHGELLLRRRYADLEVEPADAGVIENDVALGMPPNEYWLLFLVRDIAIFSNSRLGAIEEDVL